MTDIGRMRTIRQVQTAAANRLQLHWSDRTIGAVPVKIEGLSRRVVAYYSTGERRVPKAILLACKGWEASLSQSQAA